jgi:hypothetical protein
MNMVSKMAEDAGQRIDCALEDSERNEPKQTRHNWAQVDYHEISKYTEIYFML